MKLTLKEAIQSRKLKLIAKELESLARKDRGVKKVVDQLKKGKEPNPDDITSLKGDTQDDVVMAFASVIGPSKTSDFLDEEKDPCWDGYKQVGTKKGRKGKKVPNCVPEGKEDSEIGDRKGSQPASYHKGLEKSTKEKRDAQFKKQAKMDDDNPDAYKPAPGDKSAETKPSKHTKKYDKMFGEHVAELEESNVKKSLQKKSEETGVAYSILKDVYDRGVAAWRTGHRPGTTPTQWGLARVNSFVTGGKTQKTADKDLWKKHKGKNEEFDLTEGAVSVTKVKNELQKLGYHGVRMMKDKIEFKHKGKTHSIPVKSGFVSDSDYMAFQTKFESVELDEGVYIEFKNSAAKEKWMKKNNIKSNDSNLVHLSKDDAVVKGGLEKFADAKKHRDLISKTDPFKMRLSAFIDKYRKSMKKESVELDEAVRVDKKKYSWGQMITVHDGKANSFPLHPEHQKKIKSLKDGQRIVFKDESGAAVTAQRKGDQVHLSNKMSSKKVPVDYSVFTESVELDEAKMNVGDSVRVKDKPKNVVDKKFFGKAGVISGKAGQDWMVKFPNGRSIVVDAKDLEVMNEAKDPIVNNWNKAVIKRIKNSKLSSKDKNKFLNKVKRSKSATDAEEIHLELDDLGVSESKLNESYYDAPDYGHEGASDMAMTQLHFIEYAAEEVRDCLEAGAVMEEWYQNKLAKIHGDMEGLHSHMEGQKRRLEMCMGDMEVDSEEDRMSPYMYSEANHSPMHVNKAIRVAKDMGGNMTGAVEKIEKMKKGLSDHPKVKAALRMANEETDLTEKAESKAQAIAARIALKHKREGTQPEKGSASAEMMKMSEKDLEDFTKAKKGAPEKVEESVELTESHYKVGQKVKCIESGMTGTVVHVDPSDEGKYYTVKREDGKKIKYAPNELKPMGEVKEGFFSDMMAVRKLSKKLQSIIQQSAKEMQGAAKDVARFKDDEESKQAVLEDFGKYLIDLTKKVEREVKSSGLSNNLQLNYLEGYYGGMFNSLSSTFSNMSGSDIQRNLKLPEALYRKMINSAARSGKLFEAKLDPVDKAALKKKFKNRKDKDIDNDGDVDDTDEYLHKRRKAISKAVAKEQSETKLKEKDVDMDGDADDLDKSKRRRQQKVLDTSE